MSRVSEVVHQRNQDATLWVGGLDERVDEDLIWELFLQMGPLVDVSVPMDKVKQSLSHLDFTPLALPSTKLAVPKHAESGLEGAGKEPVTALTALALHAMPQNAQLLPRTCRGEVQSDQ